MLAWILAAAMQDRIDFEPDAARMEVMLPDLSKRLSRKLLSSPELRDDVLVISARGVNPDELLEKMAEALEATWEKKGDTWTLIRTPEQRAARTERDERQTLAWIRASLKANTPTEKRPVFDAREAEALARAAMVFSPGDVQPFPAQARMPYHRAQEALLDALTREDLGALPLGERVVFSSDPNAMQRRFPVKVDRVLADLKVQMALLGQAVQAQPGWKPEHRASWPFYLMVPPASRAPAKALVAAVREPSQILLRPIILDEHGKALTQEFDDGRTVLHRFVTPAPARLELPNTEIELSEESADWIRMSNSAYGPYRFEGDALEVMFRRCDRRDPLGLVYNDAVRALSRASNRPMVLALTDGSVWDVRMSARLSKLTVRSFRRLLDSAGFDLREYGRWDVGVQPFPSSIDYERVDRKAVAAFAKRWDTEGAASLESAAELVSPQPFGCWPNLTWFLSRIGPYIGASRNADPLLRVYGLANASQKDALRSGRTLRYDVLSKEQKRVIDHATFVQYWEIDLVYNVTHSVRAEGDWEGGSWVPGYKDEITEILPRGIPGDAPVSMTSSTAEVAAVRRENGIVAQYSDESICSIVDSARGRGTDANLRFKMATRNKLDLDVRLTPHITKQFNFLVTRAAGTEWLPFNKMPPAFRKRIEDGIRARDSSGRVNPPPRRMQPLAAIEATTVPYR